ncbi:uncharacterized protein LOC113296936 [Papaver somniferum]|nr:uncharacterized protein LOC113296936 [Papaver somniferum]
MDDVEEKSTSVIMASLQSYKEALANNDESTVSEIEAFLQSVEVEKVSLENEVKTLTEELASMKDRTLRIGADFDNFRKRTERERLSLVTNVQGEVVESFLSVMDNFERAKSQIKAETEGEEKINNSYQSIYKQFLEVLGSLGVVSVETVGHPFDPLVFAPLVKIISAICTRSLSHLLLEMILILVRSSTKTESPSHGSEKNTAAGIGVGF